MTFLHRLLQVGVLAITGLMGAALASERSQGELTVPDRYAGSDAQTPAPTVSWWEELQDAQLSGLIEDALVQNLDMRSMDRQIAMSRALTHQSIAPVLPMVGVELGQ